MSLTWSTLPLLPLRCILHHLSTEDAMAAMSTCRHWRSALYMYEGRKELLKLKAKYLEQCLFLTRVFKKHVKKLHIYLDCNEPEIDKFMTYVLMQYFDTVKLQELVFIGPSYVQQSMHLPFIKLRRMLIETLVFKNVKCIKKLSFMGCGMAAVRNDNERYSHKALELYARPLKFCSVQTAADTVLSSVNQQLMQISSLTHVAVDYEQISTVALQTLSKLPHFRFLTLNITNRRFTLRPIDWDILHDYYRCQLRVAINITLSKLPHFRFLTLNITNRRFTLRPIDWDILHDYYRCQLRVAINITGSQPLLSWEKAREMMISTAGYVTHIWISTVALQTLSKLPHFRFLTLNITNRRFTLRPIDWDILHDYYRCQLRVAINIIGVPFRRFDSIIDNVLIEGLRLISLKVMFCKSLYTPMLSHVSRLFQTTLVEVLWVDTPYDSTDPYHRIVRPMRQPQVIHLFYQRYTRMLSHVSRLFQTTLVEVLWVDTPYDSTDPYHRIVRPMRQPQPDTYTHVNPFVLLCWQCMHLQRLVIHGYWIWQYDVLGFVRLRKGLIHLEISAIYSQQDTFNSSVLMSEEGTVRVLCGDEPPEVDPEYVQEVNEYTDFKWKPVSWQRLHPALRPRSTAQQRLDYIVSEAKIPLGVA
ncbi:LOW QUALITY PROTEIN: uncharacterized protein LOC110377286 [Helicoverpa armigera]|uniref:LOW QUALITY PROTEIN: uncharacterized protein LOC110377286 n=1 Tax=Helicoverpa armigera TaxID=29058 RepID=UPI003083C288